MSFDSFAFPLPTRPADAEESVQPAPEVAAAEAEIVDELFQILVECLERVSPRRRELLLRKFIAEIGKGAAALQETLCRRGVEADSPTPNKLQRFKVKKPKLDNVPQRFKVKKPNLDNVDKDEPEEDANGKPP